MWKTMWIVWTKVPDYQGIVSNCTKKKRTYSEKVFEAPGEFLEGYRGAVQDFHLVWVGQRGIYKFLTCLSRCVNS
jgi:hypothetical protein